MKNKYNLNPFLGGLVIFLMSGLNPLNADAASYSIQVQAADTLQLISLSNYGTCRRWRLIADFNKIGPPYIIKKGANLKMPFPRKITQEEGEILTWRQSRKKFGLPLNGLDYEQALASRKKMKKLLSRRPSSIRPVEEVALNPVQIQFRKEWAGGGGSKLLRNNKFEQVFNKFALNKKNDFMAKATENGTENATENNDEKTRPEPSLIDKKVIWLEGTAADVIYRSLTKVSVTPSSLDYHSAPPKELKFGLLERKVGKNLSCIRQPLVDDKVENYLTDSKGDVVFKVRCIGYLSSNKIR